MNENMVYAPILIPTLCRAKHFIRCFESLKQNSYASGTDVYIALDYPLNESHVKGYKEICEYLDKQSGEEFNKLIVIKREKNYGATLNIQASRELIFEKYDRFIYAEDDIEFAENFLEYMDKCLMKFENDDEVIAVNGYSYPIEWVHSAGSNILKENFICAMWGTGFWRDKFLEMREENKNGMLVDAFDNFLRSKKYKNITDKCLNDYVSEITSYERKFIYGTSDIASRMYIAVKNKWVIMPAVSKVRNRGFDGSGLYCQNIKETGRYAYNYDYSTQKIDTADNFEIVMDTQNSNSVNLKLLNKFDKMALKDYIKMHIKLVLYKMLGAKKCVALKKKYKELKR